MPDPTETQKEQSNYRARSRSIVSAVTQGGQVTELVYDPLMRKTAFAVWEDGSWRIQSSVKGERGEACVPYSPDNNLLRNEVVFFPSRPSDYSTEQDLITELQAFIHRYVDVTPQFERIASYYVLFSWVYDSFAELPYLRVRGDYGSGKTRFLLTVGSLCYKPIFASGATSTSAIFRLLDAFRGTLIIDEGDFRYSDEKADLVKIFNNGNQQGLPVIKTEVSGNREFNPRAFQVFGPKILASRGFFEDRALESRFLTEETGTRQLRRDIPISLPARQKEEARALRNKLLLFRFRNYGKRVAEGGLVDRRIEPRLNQIFVPLMSIIEDPRLRNELRALALQYHKDLVTERGFGVEGQLLEVIRELRAHPEAQEPTVKAIRDAFAARFGENYQEHKITPHWIGAILRKKLQLRTHKSGSGAYVIPFTEEPKLERLYSRYGITGSEVEVRAVAVKGGDHSSSKAPESTDSTDFQGG